ncbi:MAG: tetratricopeptide repeat protein [Syntrophales bacterium]|jgi:tetratricopeptide (TPR) repeat protein|nr:tetratricopeptide repeat protein [Syntrophales bacterium]MCK9528590.1 tetratricopeptide repeat protein [Syntrophales bacterium]MDX9922773.1 tetratricopeptide repeat protein [Syntrophales bacterium]
MITGADGFDLHVRWRFPGGRQYVFACIALFVFLFVIYSNSFQGAFVFDDAHNIVENRHIHLKSLDWNSIKQTFYGIEGRKISRPVSYFTLALNYYFHGLDVFGYHVVNFIIHYLAAVFLFLLIHNTLNLPSLRERYGPTAYSTALLAALFWATSPLQVTAVTYIVQRMASMAGLFYIMAMYLYLKGRTAEGNRSRALLWGLCLLSGALAAGSKENAVLLPLGIWLFDLLLIQGASRENVIRNLKVFVPVALVVGALGLWYANIGAILSGAAYENRPFTLVERLLTQPRIVIWYLSLLFYPLASRLTLIHDIELSTSLITPWTTMPAMALILGLVVLALYLARRHPLISFSILFYFLNHIVESTFIPLELIYEHRNYIPSMFLFVPVAVAMIYTMGYFSYRKSVQFMAVIVFAFLLYAQGHVVVERNALFHHPALLWSDNVDKAPNLSRPHKNLGQIYSLLGLHDKAYELYTKALLLNNYSNLLNEAVTLNNLGSYYSHVKKDFNGALMFFEAALKVHPAYWPAHHGSAGALANKGAFAESEARLVEAINIWPDNDALRLLYAFVLLKLEKHEQAMQEARYALSLNSGASYAFCILGETLRRGGEIERSALFWEKFIERHPDSIQGHLALVELYNILQERDKLAQSVGRLIILKGSKRWSEFIRNFKVGDPAHVYCPDPEHVISIISDSCHEQLQQR